MPLGSRGGIIANGTLDEPFGAEELGKNGFTNLLELSANLEGDWYQQSVIKQMFEDFPHTVNGCVATEEITLMDHTYTNNLSEAIHLGQPIDIPLIDKSIFDHPSQLTDYGPSEFYLNYLPPNVVQQLYEALSADVETVLTAGMAYFDTDNPQVFAGGQVNDFTSDNPNENDGPLTLEQLGQRCPSLVPLIQFSQQELAPLPAGNYPIQIRYQFPGIQTFGSKLNVLLEKTDNTQ